MMKDIYHNLKELHRTRMDFSEKELSILEKYFSNHHYDKKVDLILPNSMNKDIHFINNGYVKMVIVGEYEDMTMRVFPANSYIGDSKSIFLDQPGNYRFTTITPCSILTINHENLLKLYQEEPKFEVFAGIVFREEMLRLFDWVESFYLQTPEERYENLLEKYPEFNSLLPQREIANLIGIKPESFSRMKKRMFEKTKKS